MTATVHEAAVRPAMTYGLEAAPLKKTEERKVNVLEIMHGWINRVTGRDWVQN